MTDDLYPTNTLPTALHELAESDAPRVMDVEKVLLDGKQSIARRRMAALGGGTAVLAVTGLVVGVLAPAGSAGHRDVPGPAPAASTSVSAAPVTTTPPFDPAKDTSVVDSRDPVTTTWQFGYLPPGMTALGGAYTPGVPDASATQAVDQSGFEFDVEPRSTPVSFGGATVPAQVQGAKQAYWNYAYGAIVSHDSAALAFQQADGQWMLMRANHVSKRADWQAQVLQAAAQVKKENRSLPMPFSVTGAKNLPFNSGAVDLEEVPVTSMLTFDASPKPDGKTAFRISAFKTGTSQIHTGVSPQAELLCKDADGLTICVNSPLPEPASLAAVGGAKALLADVTSLGEDPANWTTNVLR